MSAIAVRAPGKAIVCGEYAVLDGAPAISIAVDRAVVAREGNGVRSPFVEAACRHAAAALNAAPMTDVAVDSGALYDAAGKIGVGSSAAVTAAVVGLAFARAGKDLSDRAQLFAIADAAHTEAQGVKGSGIDVATSVYGGAIRFERLSTAPSIRSVEWPSPLQLTFVFSGQSASTPDLVGRVKRLRERDGKTYDARMGALAEITRSFCTALERGDARGAITIVSEWQPSLAALGHAADAPIVTPFFDDVAAIARQHGAAAKPSGAGGGDLGVVLSLADSTPSLRRALEQRGVHLLSLVPHGPARGLSLENT